MLTHWDIISHKGLGMIWAVFGPHSNLLKIAWFLMLIVSKLGNTEIICSIFVNPQNNMISDTPVC